MSALVEHAQGLSIEFGKLLAATKQLVENAPKFAWLLSDVSAKRAGFDNFLTVSIGENNEPDDPVAFENLLRGYESDYARLENQFLAAVDEYAAVQGKGCGA